MLYFKMFFTPIIMKDVSFMTTNFATIVMKTWIVYFLNLLA